MKEGTLSPFIGIRIKQLSPELCERALRTLDLFVTTLVREARRLPAGFVVTLPKVTMPEQVTALVRALAGARDAATGWSRGALRLELMVETTQAILNGRGVAALPGLVAAAEGRCTGAHFGDLRLHRGLPHHRRAPDDDPPRLRVREAGDAGGARRHRRHSSPTAPPT